jgi:hypothetical protein
VLRLRFVVVVGTPSGKIDGWWGFAPFAPPSTGSGSRQPCAAAAVAIPPSRGGGHQGSPRHSHTVSSTNEHVTKISLSFPSGLTPVANPTRTRTQTQTHN